MSSPSHRVLEEVGSAAEPAARPGYLLRRLIPESGLDVLLGREAGSRRPTLVLRVRETDRVGNLHDLSTRCVLVEKRKLPDDPAATTSIVVVLKDEQYVPHFCLVVDDFVSACQAVRDPLSAWRLLEAKLRGWLQFFGADLLPLSEERQRGLIGELHVLKLIAAKTSWPQSIDWWKGPDAEDRDFRSDRALVEVKTTIAGGRDIVRIANEHQLASPAGLHLAIWVVTLRAEERPEATVVGHVKHVRALIGSDVTLLVRFEEALRSAGYSDVQLQAAHLSGYAIAADRAFNVSDAFPRVTPAMLRGGVSRVSYDVALAQCKDSEITPDSVLQLL